MVTLGDVRGAQPSPATSLSIWEMTKTYAPYWCAANMGTEAYLGFNAFNTEKMTGSRVVDHIKLRQLVADGHTFNDELAEKVFYKPTE